MHGNKFQEFDSSCVAPRQVIMYRIQYLFHSWFWGRGSEIERASAEAEIIGEALAHRSARATQEKKGATGPA